MCTHRHGERTADRVRVGARATVALVAALIASTQLVPPAASAKTPAPAPRVVWNGGARFYVVTPDSGALAPGMTVRVLDHQREIARGEVTRVIDGSLASVRLTAGLIGAKARLDRLEVRIEPAAPQPIRALRLGLPAARRSAIAFACADPSLDLAALPRAYLAETLAVDAFRLVAAGSAGGDSMRAAAWPETLLVRQFGEPADEEIALERGELDVAVFWPGEPSARLRSVASGYQILLGDRARGVMVAFDAARDSALARRIAADMAALNAEMFGGDLRAWSGAGRAGDAAVPSPAGLHYAVDAAIPGRRPIERFLERRTGAPARVSDRTVRLAYLDEPVAPRDSMESTCRERGVLPLFTMRCPMLCGADVAAQVRALGADALANLLRCGAGGRRP